MRRSASARFATLPLVGDWIHRVSHRILPMDEKVWARVEAGPAQGLWLELNPRTGQNYLRGEAEIIVQKILAERLRPGMVFYDLGANIGLFTLLAARLVGDSGKVFSFEPDPENAARLRRNIQRNGFTNVTVVESGIWSVTGKLNFVVSGAASPDHGIGKFVTAESQPPERSLPAFHSMISPKMLRRPTRLNATSKAPKSRRFAGERKCSNRASPWIICEMHSGANRRAATELLASFGYTTTALDGDHVLAVAPAPAPADFIPVNQLNSVVALLGRPDSPTDGVADYCGFLRRALERRDVDLKIMHAPAVEENWFRVSPAALASERAVARKMGFAAVHRAGMVAPRLPLPSRRRDSPDARSRPPLRRRFP